MFAIILITTCLIELLIIVVLLIKICQIKRQLSKKENKSLYTQSQESLDYLSEDVSDVDFIALRILNYCENDKSILSRSFGLVDLAKVIGTNRNYTSKAINNSLKTNFSQLKNYYRVRYVCEEFIENQSLSQNEMFELSQFASLSSFTAAFDRHTGFSPRKWCDDIVRRVGRGEGVDVYDYIKKIELKGYNYKNLK